MKKFQIALQTPRGMHDLLKEDALNFLALQQEIIHHSLKWGFEYIRTPIVEKEEIFNASLGSTSDVIKKEMFYIQRKEKGDKYVLRPEGTTPIARAYLQNGMHAWLQPVRLFYISPMFRYEKPQAGRLREHYQWGLEIIGSEDPLFDVIIILTFDRFFKKFKLKDYVFSINSLGCLNDREKYKKELKKYYKKHVKKLCTDCQRRWAINPLRLLDCKVEKDQEYKKNAPVLIDYLCKDCEKHFAKTLEYLEKMEIQYELNQHLVRGFDYYSNTVFEIFFSETPIAIGGGGRYNDLIKFLGGKNIPGVGGAIGLERLLKVMQQHLINLKITKKPQVMVLFTTEKTKEYALTIYDKLINNDIPTAESFGKSSLSAQIELADKIGVKYCVIVGHQELGSNTVILKNMIDRTQETIHLNNLVAELKKRLK